MSISGFMGYLKGKSSLIIYQKFGQAKFQYRCREFWCRGYYVDTTGKNTEVIKKYIQNQLKRELRRWKGVEIVEGEMAEDHVHLLLLLQYHIGTSLFLNPQTIWGFSFYKKPHVFHVRLCFLCFISLARGA